MPELKGSRTYDHLLKVFAKEAIAARRLTMIYRLDPVRLVRQNSAVLADSEEDPLCRTC